MADTSAEAQPPTPLNTAYVPRSQGPSPGTLIPTNMAVSAQLALERLEKERGNIDEFVMSRLGLDTKAQLWVVLYAEQIDSLALAFDQRSKGRIFLNGDQTGNGKGRFGAANLIDARRQGYIPVFVTQKPNLYNSMLNDLADLGYQNIRPFLTNNDVSLVLDDGRKLKSGHQADQNEEMTRIARTGLGGYDAIFTTYSQMQTVRGKEILRREFLRAIAPQAIFIFDESHEAGGSTGQQGWKSGSEAGDRAAFVRELVDSSAGAVFMSATATKDPAVMDLYARRTDAVHAVSSMNNLEQTLKAGGIPLQQMMATKFVASGNLLRRERSFESIAFNAKVVAVDRQIADGISAIMRAVDRFDRAKAEALKDLKEQVKAEAKQAGEDNAIGQAGAKSANFTSLMHNAIDQGLLCQKAEATVQEAIVALQRGEKPLIAVASTMDAFIQDYAEAQGIKPGELIAITFADLLDRYLERSRDVVLKDYEGNQTRRPMTDAELGPRGVAAFLEAQAILAATDLSGIPLSSIDYIKWRLDSAGYRVDEITGRSNVIDYQPDGTMRLGIRSARETSPQTKINIVNRFNAGDLDVVILNRSGSTGINLHASEKFVDQRPRHMIVVQAERDINQVMQMLGRVNRFGQVVEPTFTLLMADVPAEKRLGALLSQKMASLNANTTAARDSNLSVSNVVDFMNAAGEEVVSELLSDNPELDALLSFPTRNIQGNSGTELISRVTGRIPLLSIEDQEALYTLIETETQALIEQKAAMGENVLEADKLDLQARTIARMEILPDTGQVRSEFTGPAYLEVVDARAIDKPMTQLQVINIVRETLELTPVRTVEEHDAATTTAIAQSFAERRLSELKQAVDVYRSDALSRLVEPEARNKLNLHLERQTEQLTTLLNQFPEGTPVQVATQEGSLVYGVIGRVWSKPKAIGSPAAATNWRIQILTDNRAKQITVSLSKVNTGRESSLIMIRQESRWDGTPIYATFDLKQADRRLEMQIVTGNLLKAYEKYPRGKFVNFTDRWGQVRQGLMMPDGFDIQEELRKEPVAFKAPHQVQAFLTEVTRNQGVVHDLDKILAIKSAGQAKYTGETATAFLVQTPVATRVGGRYFLNEDLLRAADAEFFSVSDRMEMTIPAEKLEAVLQVLMVEQQITLVTFDHKDLARSYLGEMLPQMELIAANQFEAQGDYVPFVPEPTQSSIQQLELLYLANGAEPAVTPSVHGKGATEPPSEKSAFHAIAEPALQSGLAEQNVARLLHQGRLTEAILQGEDFHLRVDNPPYLPLVIERHDTQLYLTHYREQQGDLCIDAEMVFAIDSTGQLKLTETAVQDPIRGGELRSLSASFANLFSKNLLEQGFAAGITHTLNQKSITTEAEIVVLHQNQDRSLSESPITPPAPQAGGKMMAETTRDIVNPVPSGSTAQLPGQSEGNPAIKPDSQLINKLEGWATIARSLSKPEAYVARINTVVEMYRQTQNLSDKAVTALESDWQGHTAQLNQVREWYRTAIRLGKSQPYLSRIQSVGEGFKNGEPLSEQAIAAMNTDFRYADWLTYSQGVQEEDPSHYLKGVAANTLRAGKTQVQALEILETSPQFKQLQEQMGYSKAQSHFKLLITDTTNSLKTQKIAHFHVTQCENEL